MEPARDAVALAVTAMDPILPFESIRPTALFSEPEYKQEKQKCAGEKKRRHP
jgi:hypothetical protein